MTIRERFFGKLIKAVVQTLFNDKRDDFKIELQEHTKNLEKKSFDILSKAKAELVNEVDSQLRTVVETCDSTLIEAKSLLGEAQQIILQAELFMEEAKNVDKQVKDSISSHDRLIRERLDNLKAPLPTKDDGHKQVSQVRDDIVEKIGIKLPFSK